MQTALSAVDVSVPTESSRPALHWGPIVAGALAASTVSIVLVLLGAGLGLSMVSPWAGQSASLTTLAATTAVWLVVVQWLSSGVGGYLAGRLRTKWVNVHTDEVYFRDTAHGFMVWALATFLVVGVFSSAVTAVVGNGVQAAATVTSAPAAGAMANVTDDMSGSSVPYFVDTLFRPTDTARLAADGNNEASTAEATRILLASTAAGEMKADDRTYLAQMVAARTSLSQPDAEARIDATLAQVEQAKVEAKEVADAVRKTSTTFALVTALSMAIGAFIASAAALLGGMQRDDDEDRYLAHR